MVTVNLAGGGDSSVVIEHPAPIVVETVDAVALYPAAFFHFLKQHLEVFAVGTVFVAVTAPTLTPGGTNLQLGNP